MNEETKRKGGLWLTTLLAVVCGFLGGVGTFQMTMASQIGKHTIQIEVINNTLDRHDAEHSQIREEFTKRLTALVGEQANYVQMSREFIQQMKADRDVMQQIVKQNDSLLQRLGNGGTSP